MKSHDRCVSKLTDDDAQTFFELLKRYCDEALDQFDMIRIDTEWGPVFVEITREVPPGCSEAAFRRLVRPVSDGPTLSCGCDLHPACPGALRRLVFAVPDRSTRQRPASLLCNTCECLFAECPLERRTPEQLWRRG